MTGLAISATPGMASALLNKSSIEGRAAATSAASVTFSWLLLYKKYPDPNKATALKEWVRWGLTTGQTFASASATFLCLLKPRRSRRVR